MTLPAENKMRFRIAFLVSCFILSAGDVWAINCSRASSTVELALCKEPSLLERDAELSGLYKKVQKVAVGKARKMLVAQQRAWLADRDKACATGEPICLTAAYSIRRDQFLALLATASALDDRLENITPILIRGTWRAGKIENNKSPAETEERLIFSGLPVEGQTFTAAPGKLCFQGETCTEIGWWETTIGDLQGGARVAADLSVSPTTKAYKGSTGSIRSDLTIFPGPGRSLQAIVILCGPKETDCRNHVEPWIPVSDDARIEIGTRMIQRSK